MVHPRSLGDAVAHPWRTLAAFLAPHRAEPARAGARCEAPPPPRDAFVRGGRLDARTAEAVRSGAASPRPAGPQLADGALWRGVPGQSGGRDLGWLLAPMPTTPPPSARAVRAAERRLAKLGFEPGRADGVLTDKTRAALSEFQGAVGLASTGNLDAGTSRAIARRARWSSAHGRGWFAPGMKGPAVRRLQHRLARLGDFHGTPDGVFGASTAEAVKKLRARHGELKDGVGYWSPRADRSLRRELAHLAHDPYRTRVKPTEGGRRLDRRAALEASGAGIGPGSPRAVVAHVQRQLVASGYDPNRTDGRWTDHTQAMVQEFQRRAGLPVTDRVDARTFDRLARSTMETRSAFRPAQGVGERSAAVLRTERKLAALGLAPGKVDGLYTEATERAADRLRRHYRVSADVDGVGVHTAHLIDRRLRERGAVQKPVDARLGSGSEFMVPDAEGAPSARGGRYHAGKDWFAPGGTRVRAPIAGTVVEVRPSSGRSGQVFGGTVKVQGRDGKVWVFRHVEPGQVRVGRRVGAGQAIARVTPWTDGPSHTHIELWKTLAGGYRLENMIDPMKYLRRFA